MAIQPTQAAKELQDSADVSPHKLISLLMQGVLERVRDARIAVDKRDLSEQEVLLTKTVKLINALRDSLNFDEGGEVAVNLDRLYDYMLARIEGTRDDQQVEALEEVASLMKEVKAGWDQISADAA